MIATSSKSAVDNNVATGEVSGTFETFRLAVHEPFFFSFSLYIYLPSNPLGCDFGPGIA